MAQHPDHYSLPMRLLGSDAVAWMQEKGLGAGVWFNVEVEVNGKVSEPSEQAATLWKPALELTEPPCRSSSTAPSPSMPSVVTCSTGKLSISAVVPKSL